MSVLEEKTSCSLPSPNLPSGSEVMAAVLVWGLKRPGALSRGPPGHGILSVLFARSSEESKEAEFPGDWPWFLSLPGSAGRRPHTERGVCGTSQPPRAKVLRPLCTPENLCIHGFCPETTKVCVELLKYYDSM